LALQGYFGLSACLDLNNQFLQSPGEARAVRHARRQPAALRRQIKFGAMATSAEQSNLASDPGAGPSPRKFKASELPLPSATRAAIESLAHSFKKEGAYDSIRKQVWDKFEASVRRTRINNQQFPFLLLIIFPLSLF
jgi:hypothetical protein